MKTLKRILIAGVTTLALFTFAVLPAFAAAELTLTKNANKDTAEGCDYITYNITIENTGDATANNVVVTDIVDGRFIFTAATSGSVTPVITPMSGGQTKIVWNMGNMAADAKSNLSFNVASPFLTTDTTIANTVTATGDGSLTGTASDSVVIKATPVSKTCGENTGGVVPPPVPGTGGGLPNTGLNPLVYLVAALIPAGLALRTWKLSRAS